MGYNVLLATKTNHFTGSERLVIAPVIQIRE